MSLEGTTYVLSTGANTENVVDIYTGTDTVPETVYVGESGGTTDDHNNGAFALEPGEAPIVFYSQHSGENFMNYRVATRPIEEGFGPFGDEQTISSTGGVTYPHVHVVDGVIHLLWRDDLKWWTYTKSTDWGQTWSTRRRFVAHAYQCHLASAVRGSTLRFVIGAHPGNGDENIYYGEINLTTGAITKSDGTVLGNLDGTSLPIAVAGFEVVDFPTVDVGNPYKWVYDVSDTADPEVVWVSYSGSDLAGTSTYHYSKRTAGVWATEDVIAAGGRFSDPSQPYIGGAQLPILGDGGIVYTARQDGTRWKVERHVTDDEGASWTTTLLGQSDARLVRAWPVDQRGDDAPPFEAVGNLITRFGSYSDMVTRIVPLAPNDSFD